MQLYFNPVCFTKSRSSPRKSRWMSFKRVLKPNLQPRCIIVIRLDTALKSCAANDRQTRETFSWLVPQKPWNRDVYRFRIANEGAVNDVHDTSGVFIYKETLHYHFFPPFVTPVIFPANVSHRLACHFTFAVSLTDSEEEKETASSLRMKRWVCFQIRKWNSRSISRFLKGNQASTWNRGEGCPGTVREVETIDVLISFFLFSTSLTVPGQTSLQIHVKAWLPFRNREVDYWLLCMLFWQYLQRNPG